MTPALIRRIDEFGSAAHALPPAPVPAVVLGARVFPSGQPSAALVGRVERAAALYHRSLAARLVLSGGSPDTRPAEAHVMLRLAGELNVPAEACTVEADSRTTIENARHCARLLGAAEVLLVTSDFHLYRATRVFEAHGFTVWPVAARSAERGLARTRLLAREAVALHRLT